MYREGFSCGFVEQRRFNTFAPNKAPRINEAGLNIFFPKKRVKLDDFLGRTAGSEHTKDVLHGNAAAANDGFPAKYGRINAYAIQQLPLVFRWHFCITLAFSLSSHSAHFLTNAVPNALNPNMPQSFRRLSSRLQQVHNANYPLFPLQLIISSLKYRIIVVSIPFT
jgi:hypothetical protein